jgi:hypothetical protein
MQREHGASSPPWNLSLVSRGFTKVPLDFLGDALAFGGIMLWCVCVGGASTYVLQYTRWGPQQTAFISRLDNKAPIWFTGMLIGRSCFRLHSNCFGTLLPLRIP